MTDVALLEARELTFSYPHTEPILSRWSAKFHAGTVTALTGPSGKGKSTLLYLLGLMLRPTGGQIFIDGSAASSLNDSDKARMRAEKFGFVFQDAALDATRTVLENVTETALYRSVSRRAATARGIELLDRFGVDVPAWRKPGQVSGGQAQRIALCRALLNEPAILLADEPTGNLDPDSTGVVVTALQNHAASGAAVIVVTHSPDVAAACDLRIQL